MKNVNENVTKLTDEDKFLLERDVTLTEIETALKQMKNGKSPGIDGLSIEFKTFWTDIKNLLMRILIA